MSNKPVFAVVGGTGSQGSSVVHAISALNEFRLRVLTRNTESSTAKELKKKYGDSLEFVEGSYLDSSTLEKLFEGAYYAFVLTNMGPNEEESGKRMADVAKAKGVKRVIFSSLVDVAGLSQNKLYVPHFTMKHNIEEYMRQIGLDIVAVAPAFYYQNWLRFFYARQMGDKFVIALPTDGVCIFENLNLRFSIFKVPYAQSLATPDTYIPAVDIHELGNIVAAVVKDWDKYRGKFIPVAADHLRVKDYVRIISEVTGYQIDYFQVPWDNFKQQVGVELTEMLRWFQEYGYYGPNHDWKEGQRIAKLTPFREWAQKNANFLKPRAA